MNNHTVSRGFPHLKEIKESLKLLFCFASSKKLPRPYGDLIENENFYHTEDAPALKVQKMAKKIAEHLNLAVGPIVVSFRGDMSVPAHVELSNSSEFYIEIDAAHETLEHHLAAILAHEVMHIYLHRNGISMEPELANEILTDTGTVFFGLGALVLNGFDYSTSTRYDYLQSNQIITETKTHTFGYLTVDEFGYLQAKMYLMKDGRWDYGSSNNLIKEAYVSGHRRAENELRRNPIALREGSFLEKLRYKFLKRSALKRMRAFQTINGGLDISRNGFGFDINANCNLLVECPWCCQVMRFPILGKKIKGLCRNCGENFAGVV
jgi:hypothetical protein